MIIYDGEKYACVSCIRGHRSSTCRHTSRMLVKVRNRGRHASIDIRKVIIVDTESQVTPDDGSPACCESNSEGRECDKMNKQPILFLRTIKMQRAILIDGKLQIIVDEKDSLQLDGSVTDKPSFKYISEKEFLRQHSIQMNDHNVRSGCSCSGNESVRKTADGSKILPKIELENGISWKKSCSHNITNKKLNFEEEELSNSTVLDAQVGCKHSNNNLPVDAQLNPNSTVELFTHRGLYLSTQCSCEDDNCQCSNCLLHRNEEELNSYIQRSGVPLTNLGEAQLANLPILNRANDCKCLAEECQCDGCLEHPTEIISFNKFVIFGILNVPLRRKTIINFKGKLIPSQYWWDFLKLQVPLMPEVQLDSLDIVTWFEKIASTYASQLIDANNFHVDVTQAFFNV